MTARLDQLNEDRGHAGPHLCDVYHKTRWPMYTLVSKINSMGMAMATEYPSAVDQHSVWAHHVGAHVTQDSLAGNLIRFVNNQYQDILRQQQPLRGTNRVSGIKRLAGRLRLQRLPGALLHQRPAQPLPGAVPIMQWENTNEVVLV